MIRHLACVCGSSYPVRFAAPPLRGALSGGWYVCGVLPACAGAQHNQNKNG